YFLRLTKDTEIYTLSLHAALPISHRSSDGTSPSTRTSPAWAASTSTAASWSGLVDCSPRAAPTAPPDRTTGPDWSAPPDRTASRSEEHTSELQSRENLVCRLLLEK